MLHVPPPATTRGRGRLREAVVGPAVLVLAAVLLVTVVRSTVATPVRVSSSSMLPTLARGDVVLVDPEVAADDLEHGDVITFTDPEDGRTSLKRVVGLPGERLVIKDAVLHVDDEPVDEPYVDHEAIDAYYTPTFSVPAGSVFLMGDNRSNSEDSRSYGSVITNAVQGRVLVRVWPPVRFGGPHGRPPKP